MFKIVMNEMIATHSKIICSNFWSAGRILIEQQDSQKN